MIDGVDDRRDGAGRDLARLPAGQTPAHAARHERGRTGSARGHGKQRRASRGGCTRPSPGAENSTPPAPGCRPRPRCPTRPGCGRRDRRRYLPPAPHAELRPVRHDRQRPGLRPRAVDARARSLSRPSCRRRRKESGGSTGVSDVGAGWRSDRAFNNSTMPRGNGPTTLAGQPPENGHPLLACEPAEPRATAARFRRRARGQGGHGDCSKEEPGTLASVEACESSN
jgi:hypothetical protein